MVMFIDSDEIVVSTYDPKEMNQKWVHMDDMICLEHCSFVKIGINEDDDERCVGGRKLFVGTGQLFSLSECTWIKHDCQGRLVLHLNVSSVDKYQFC